ncbi:MAG TPA: endonuclease/exonuclease/phosphatase family protein [Saprospiraceae bacterium]|nr:endonuclease/exonuclease/phosphatase family protein [Saprospiraceae bacterium]
MKKWILGINLFFILLLGLTYLTPHIPSHRWGLLTLLTLAYPFTLLINGLFAAGWLFVRNWFAAFSIIAILLGWPVHSRYFKLFSFHASKATCQDAIEVLSYNLRGLSMITAEHGASAERRIETLYGTMIEAKIMPDIISIQEGIKGELIGEKFGLLNSFHGSKSSLWVLTKYPIVDHGELSGEEANPFCIWADLKTDEGMLRVYNMHLMSNRVTNTTEELIQDMDFQKENTWNNIKFIVGRYTYTTQKRAREAAMLKNHLKTCPYPALITGDGNDTPLSNTYHVLVNGMTDSFSDQGIGLSTTYDNTLPLLRIDYLLATPGISFRNHLTYHLHQSDHYPISTAICLATKGSS